MKIILLTTLINTYNLKYHNFLTLNKLFIHLCLKHFAKRILIVIISISLQPVIFNFASQFKTCDNFKTTYLI